MTRDFATDPEIAADLIRRARSERDRDRTCEASNPFGSSAAVEHWPCRGGCGRMCEVTAIAIEAFEVNNRELARRREPPIAKAKIMWCPECKARHDELERMQAEAKAAARKPHEQTAMPLGEGERPSGQRTNRRRNSL